ncbi:MAG: PspA/IM30 family protein [Polyangiales bacterium]
MGIIDRAKRAISSNVNSLIDKAEDPRKMVELTLDEMKDHIGRARQDVISAVASEKQLRKKTEELKTHVDKWEQRAILAVKAGDDALAREALKQKAQLFAEQQATEARREEQYGLALKMRDDLEAMEAKHKELSAKKGTIATKVEMARGGGGSESLGARGGPNAFEAFRGIEDKIEQQEAEGAAMRELEGDVMKEAELESKFRRLEGGVAAEQKGTAVDDELSALKARIRIKTET